MCPSEAMKRRKRDQVNGNSSWEEKKKEKKVQKTLEEYTEEENA